MKLTNVAVSMANEQADLAADFFNGGRIELYPGVQAGDVDTDFLPRVAIASYQLRTPAFTKARDGRIHLYPVEPAAIQNPGIITWGRAFAEDGRRLMDFSVGEREHLFDMVVDRATAKLGDELIMISFSHSVALSSEGH